MCREDSWFHLSGKDRSETYTCQPRSRYGRLSSNGTRSVHRKRIAFQGLSLRASMSKRNCSVRRLDAGQRMPLLRFHLCAVDMPIYDTNAMHTAFRSSRLRE